MVSIDGSKNRHIGSRLLFASLKGMNVTGRSSLQCRMVLIVAILMGGLSSRSAYAGDMLIEPAGGYNVGHYDTYSASGLGFDMKLGIKLGSQFFLAGDVDYASLNLTPVNSSSGTNLSGTLTDGGAVVGVDVKGWRVWFAYYIYSKMSYSNGGVDTAVTGSAHKFGVGGDLSPNASFNLEFLQHNFTSLITSGTSVETKKFMDLGFLSLSWRF